MFEPGIHSIPWCIVSLAQPWVQSIVQEKPMPALNLAQTCISDWWTAMPGSNGWTSIRSMNWAASGGWRTSIGGAMVVI